MLQKKRIRNHILQTFTSSHHLLHSDKSTYFYNNKHSNGSNNNVTKWHKLAYSHSWQTIPLVCSSFALLGLGIGLVNPSIHGGIGGSSGSAYATTITNDLTDSASISFSISNSVSGELDNDSTISTEVVPGLVSYIDNNIKVTTKQIDRFYVGVQAASDGTSELIGTTNKATISGVGEDVSPREFGDNTWGYALTNTNASSDTLTYNSLPAYSAANTPQYTSNKNLTDGEYNLKLVFAAKINANSPADHYTTKAIVSILADTKALTTLFDITYMQEMTSDICNATPAPTAEDIKTKTYDEIITATPSKQLKDTRDGKYYWVSKLADGNCWMTQNLDFDVPDTLSSADTDIQEDEEGVIKTVTTNTAKVVALGGWNNTDKTYNAYYDPGDYIYSGPDDTHGFGIRCDVASNSTLSSCKQFTMTVPNANSLGEHDAHYNVGNYYSWSAATVKSGDSMTINGISAPSSICPKGWKIPTSTSNTAGQFAELLTGYGVNSNFTNGSYAIYKEPLYFVYDGYIYNSTLYHTGSTGAYWSSTIKSNTRALHLYFGTQVSPAYDGDIHMGLHYVGFPIRCTAE